MLQERSQVPTQSLQVQREIRPERRDRKRNDALQSLAKIVRLHLLVISEAGCWFKRGFAAPAAQSNAPASRLRRPGQWKIRRGAEGGTRVRLTAPLGRQNRA